MADALAAGVVAAVGVDLDCADPTAHVVNAAIKANVFIVLFLDASGASPIDYSTLV